MDRDLKANLDAVKYYQQNPTDVSNALTSAGASMSAHPVLAAIGAVVLVGAAIAYFVSKEERKG
jgi:hypothetical protein